MFYSTTYPSPLGAITLSCDGDKLVGLWFVKQKYYGTNYSEEMTEKDDLPVFDAAKKWLDRYFEGKKTDATQLPLAPEGSEFQQGVWDILLEIPYGEVITYGDIAKKMAVKMKKVKMSAQAVGGAVGRNPISIIIPCHRVVGANGNLTGFGGGIDKKVKLLEIEGLDMSRFHMPKKDTI